MVQRIKSCRRSLRGPTELTPSAFLRQPITSVVMSKRRKAHVAHDPLRVCTGWRPPKLLAKRLSPHSLSMHGDVDILDDKAGEAAIALLVPIDWPEPFGLVMIEAMACGTPVIAFNRGSVPEVIEDGLTGFIVEDVNGAIGAVDRLAHLSREKIRQRFEQRFPARRMAHDYLAVYRRLMDKIAPHLRLVADDAPAL